MNTFAMIIGYGVMAVGAILVLGLMALALMDFHYDTVIRKGRFLQNYMDWKRNNNK